ncbi:MAG: RNA methyltransferase [bacterium]|nr:RNA methyltransferase [bacterium]
MSLRLIATCGLGLEEFLEAELRALGASDVRGGRGAVTWSGSWRDCWRANWRLRTANRVLVELGQWDGGDGDALAAGARALIRRRKQGSIDVGGLFDPRRTFSIRATTTASRIRDLRWAALKVKDGLVDGQRDRYRQRSSIDRDRPDLSLRLRLKNDRATLTLDTSGVPLDRRGYRVKTSDAPLREQLAAACVLASGWDGRGPVVDPMCGSGTLLTEAALIALGRAPGFLRARHGSPGWAFERLPSYDAKAFATIREEPIPALGKEVELFGADRSPAALGACRANLERAGLSDHARLRRDDAFELHPPETPGLFVVNPAYGERLEEEPAQWQRLGDLLKQRYAGWRAVVLAGGETRGKPIGLRPKRRIPVLNGPLDARILIFDMY